MIFGKPRKEKALLLTLFEGYGDLIYHTPTIRALSKVHAHLDVWCKQPEPFYNNPYIKTLKVFKDFIPDPHTFYGNYFYLVNGKCHHTRIHTVDTVSIDALRHVLRNSEKALDLFWTQEDMHFVQQLLITHPLSKKNRIEEGKFIVISPSITWPSRTLPLWFFKQLISSIQEMNYGVVLVGKDIVYPTNIDINKTLYPSDHFPGTICLYNQLTLAQLAALYSITPITINTENGNHPMSCTNNYTWDIYIAMHTAPEYLIPFRQGSQKYRTAVIENAADYYPTSIHGKTNWIEQKTMPVYIPKIEKVLDAFISVQNRIKEGKNYL
jgi:hypothetical protein